MPIILADVKMDSFMFYSVLLSVNKCQCWIQFVQRLWHKIGNRVDKYKYKGIYYWISYMYNKMKALLILFLVGLNSS